MAYRRTPDVCARQARTRAAILGAARDLVAHGGLAGTGMAEVAAAAGVGVGTVYRHFPSKADLIGEVVGDVCRHELDIVARVASPDAGTPRERLVAAVRVFARRALRSGRTAYAMIAEPTDAEVEMLRLEIRSRLAAIFARIVADGIRSGDFVPQSPDVSGTAIVGGVSEVLVGPLSPIGRSDADPEDLLDEIGRFAVRAVAPVPDAERVPVGR